MAKKSAFEDTVETAAPPPPDPVPPPEPPPAVEATYTPPPAPLPDPVRERIVDLCRHAVRTDPGGTGRLATQILADLGVS